MKACFLLLMNSTLYLLYECFFFLQKLDGLSLKKGKRRKKSVYKIQFHAQKTQLLKNDLVNMGKNTYDHILKIHQNLSALLSYSGNVPILILKNS